MCGRMTLTRSGDEIAAFFALEQAAEESSGGPVRARYNIAPSQPVLTVLEPKGENRIGAWKTWGLIPSWSKDPSRGGSLFNARSETVDAKPSFRAAWRRRRCLVVADGFYEWSPRNQGHQPYHFTAAEGSLLAMAGLYEEWVDAGDASKEDQKSGSTGGIGSGEVIESCTVLTTEANADLSDIHHRMPVLLGPQDFAAWLNPETDPDSLRPLLTPSPDGTLSRMTVSDYVNSPRNDDADCLMPLPPKKPAEPPAQGDLFAEASVPFEKDTQMPNEPGEEF